MKEKTSISIPKETHTRIKEHCDKYGFKIHGWVDNILRIKLDELNKKS
jgi:hypothetical protein